MRDKIRNIVKIAGRVLPLAAAALPMAGLEGCGRELVLLSEQAVVELGEEPDLYAGRYVYLGERDAQEAVVDFSGVNTGAVGVYPASVRFGGQEVSFEVLVRDTTGPELSVNSHVTATVGAPLYASEVVIGVAEASGQAEIFFVKEEDGSDDLNGPENAEAATQSMEDGEVPDGESFVSGEVLCTNGAVVYGQTGEYELLVMAVDASGNCAAETVQVTVGEPPVFTGICDRQVTVGDTKYDYLGGVTAVDYRGTDVTKRVVCDSTEVDVSVEGEYEIRYFVRDDQGFFAEECALVTVCEKGAGADNSSRTGAGGKQSDPAAGKKTADAKRNAAGTGGADGTGQSAGGAGQGTVDPGSAGGTGQIAGGTGGTGQSAGGTGQGTGGTGGSGSAAGPGQNSGGSGTGSAAGTSQGGSGTGGTAGPGQAAGATTPGGSQQQPSAPGSSGTESTAPPDGGNPGQSQPGEGQGTPTLEDLGFEAYAPEAGAGADDGTDLGGTSEWY